VALDFSQMADRQVHRDSKEPGVGPCVAAEAVELHQTASERFLREFARLFVVADHPQDGVVEPVLVSHDELPVGGPITLLGLSEQFELPPDRRIDCGIPDTWVGEIRGRLVGLELSFVQARHGFGRGGVCEVPGLRDFLSPHEAILKVIRDRGLWQPTPTDR
jgi:hypothetical protein